MTDIIHLLPESIANQIAAGEVVQRPASIVKELMENAVDAKATSIKVLVKEGGKALVQVQDNGCGMSETDARMSFERHATSKIKEASDLFNIKTMGFRGEALASIAAVAKVEMKTQQATDAIGVRLVVESSSVKSQEVCQLPEAGTVIAVKNLFFSVPARRNFLKSNVVEMRHITDEFIRVALAHPEVGFSLTHNEMELYRLMPGKLSHRLVGLFGNSINKNLIPVKEDTEVMTIKGYVGRPEYSKKKRGDQFFIVNGRFIKSPYLHHAVITSFENLLVPDTHPFYCLFIDINPKMIDINVHPTKQEIKFDDDRLVYNYVLVAVKHALGQHSIMPSLDFSQEREVAGQFEINGKAFGEVRLQSSSNFSPNRLNPGFVAKSDRSKWKEVYEGISKGEESLMVSSKINDLKKEEPIVFSEDIANKRPYLIHSKYIASPIKSGFILIDQQAAQERILYEHYMAQMKSGSVGSQQSLFPTSMRVSPADAELFRSILPQLANFGLDAAEVAPNTFIIKGMPGELAGRNEIEVMEQLLDQVRNNLDLNLDLKENIARSMARSGSRKKEKPLDEEAMTILIDRLFACQMPYQSPSGRKCFLQFDLDELNRRFG
jgi:DNA mismatch repair protein MutL